MYFYILTSKINHGTCHIIGSLSLIVFVWDHPFIVMYFIYRYFYDMSFINNIRQSEFIAYKKNERNSC